MSNSPETSKISIKKPRQRGIAHERILSGGVYMQGAYTLYIYIAHRSTHYFIRK